MTYKVLVVENIYELEENINAMAKEGWTFVTLQAEHSSFAIVFSKN